MRHTAILIALTIIVVFTIGCTSILEDERVTETVREITPVDRPPATRVEVANYEELKSAIIELMMTHESSGRIIASSYEGEEVEADVRRAIFEILTFHPIGVYAVSEIVGDVTRIVTLYEIDIEIEYSRTSQQVGSIITVSSETELNDELLGIMRDYGEIAVFRTPLQLSVDELVNVIVDTYYKNPREIVMRPIVAVEVFPESGEDRIFSISFDFGRPQGILRALGGSLTLALTSNVEAAAGETNAEILLSLSNGLIAFANFDEVVARIPEHGIQNPAATAFGALINGSATGEGFAMALKALCDELGITAHVILGYLDGRHHAWNLVNIDGFYYHIDVAMGDVNGIETVFLKNDQQFRAIGYQWDQNSTPQAIGQLTYEDVAGENEPENIDDGRGNGAQAPQDPNIISPEPPEQSGGEPEDPTESDDPAAPENPGDTGRPSEPEEPTEPDEPELPEAPDEPDEQDETDESRPQ